MRDTIKKHTDFLTTSESPSATSAFFIVRTKIAKDPNNPRYGLVVAKRTFKFAVERNRAKRLLRDWIAHAADMMAPEYDYIFIARSAILSATREQGRSAMINALEHIMHKHVCPHKKSLQKNS